MHRIRSETLGETHFFYTGAKSTWKFVSLLGFWLKAFNPLYLNVLLDESCTQYWRGDYIKVSAMRKSHENLLLHILVLSCASVLTGNVVRIEFHFRSTFSVKRTVKCNEVRAGIVGFKRVLLQRSTARVLHRIPITDFIQFSTSVLNFV